MKHLYSRIFAFTVASTVVWLMSQLPSCAAPNLGECIPRARPYLSQIIDHDPLSISLASATVVANGIRRSEGFTVVNRQDNVVRFLVHDRSNKLSGKSQITVTVYFTPEPYDTNTYYIQLQPLSLQSKGQDSFRLQNRMPGVSVEGSPKIGYGSDPFTTFTVDLSNRLFKNSDNSNGENKQKIYFIAYKATSASNPDPLDEQICIGNVTAIKDPARIISLAAYRHSWKQTPQRLGHKKSAK